MVTVDHRRLLLNTQREWVFNINVTRIDSRVVMPEPWPPCPRVNTWAVGFPPGTFVNFVTSYSESYPYQAPLVGVDIFYWNGIIFPTREQYVVVEASNFSLSSDGQDVDTPSQNKFQLQYDRPGEFTINIQVINI